MESQNPHYVLIVRHDETQLYPLDELYLSASASQSTLFGLFDDHVQIMIKLQNMFCKKYKLNI